MATKTYFVGPQDGWVNVLTTTAKASLRISAFPHTMPFYVYGDTTITPSIAADLGVQVCHKPFELENQTAAGNVEKFYVRVVNPSLHAVDGRTRFDVHCDGAALA